MMLAIRLESLKEHMLIPLYTPMLMHDLWTLCIFSLMCIEYGVMLCRTPQPPRDREALRTRPRSQGLAHQALCPQGPQVRDCPWPPISYTTAIVLRLVHQPDMHLTNYCVLEQPRDLRMRSLRRGSSLAAQHSVDATEALVDRLASSKSSTCMAAVGQARE
jgi:hypothetical protein